MTEGGRREGERRRKRKVADEMGNGRGLKVYLKFIS